MTRTPTPYSWSRSAIQYTREQVGLVPSNRPDRAPIAIGWSVATCVAPGRSGQYWSAGGVSNIMNIRRMASRAKNDDCGNCGEYAAVVFDYLYLSDCLFPIEYTHYRRPGDHAFVIVGRTQGDAADPATWNEDAVVADAWANRIVSGSDYYTRMYGYPELVHPPSVQVRYHRQVDFAETSATARRA